MDNFYNFVNNKWLDEIQIPNEFDKWGTFNILSEENGEKIKKIIDYPYDNISPYYKVNLLYRQGMDIDKRNDISEIYDYIKEIQSKKNIRELLELVVDYQLSCNIISPFYLSVFNDHNEPDKNILHLSTGGLGLPDKEYYTSDMKVKEQIEYKNFLTTFTQYFKLDIDINQLYELEKLLAKYTYSSTQKRDAKLQNNVKNLTEILSYYPSFIFLEYFFKKLGIQPNEINVTNPDFFFNLNNMFLQLDLQLWKNYFIVKFLLSCQKFLSVEVEQIVFNFYQNILLGTKEIKPLHKRVINNIESQLGELVGKCFVEKYFTENAMNNVLDMVKYLKNELYNRITKLEWMEDETKKKALEKLRLMNIKIGYPEKWREYKSKLEEGNSYLKNNIECNKDDNMYMFNKLYKKVNKMEWFMNPQDVNAYYSPNFNEIVFPAGILQPPFFDVNYDIAKNYGGIGCIIGHELSHGFDDMGCNFDGYGKLHNWWTDEDLKKYKNKIMVLKDQFDNFEFEGTKVNGELTLGENIADLCGVLIALSGLKNKLDQNISNVMLKKFFISYAEIWRCKLRPESIKTQLLTDPHSLPEFRVNGILNNVDDFYKVFDVKDNSLLYLEPNKRARIW